MDSKVAKNNDGFLKSPLNYTGNKYRILDQIIKYFPKKVGTFVDMFCGGATVGINVGADKVVFIDSNPRVISLLRFISKNNFRDLVKLLERKIVDYNLSYSNLNGYSHYFELSPPLNKNNGLKKYNSAGFYKLREDYNGIINKESDEANLLLYLLLIYGFNNDLRFNKSGCYNLPCGKTDLNKNNLSKLERFIEKSNNSVFEFICGDFLDNKIQNIALDADFIYFDPPYLITDAFYNESGGWSIEYEKKLIHFLIVCLQKRVPFVLSNVIYKNRGIWSSCKFNDCWHNEYC